jgi:hypothetical protein
LATRREPQALTKSRGDRRRFLHKPVHFKGAGRCKAALLWKDYRQLVLVSLK